MEKAPVLENAVRKLASKAARGVRIPQTVTVKGLDYVAQRELEHLFGTVGGRDSSGGFYIQLLPMFQERSAWRDAIEYFGLAGGGSSSVTGNVFERLKMLEPCLGPLVDMLSANDEVARFARKAENQKAWLCLAKGMREHILRGRITTLSQLGSDLFGDSKRLRSGPLRRQLVIMAATLAGFDPDDERKVLEGALIVDNPYTSYVTFSAPVKFTLRDGSQFDYPDRHFALKMAVQLPLETVLEIDEIEWMSDSMRVTTSENAAPFARLVAENTPSVYTAGYPCLAVKVLLHKLSEKGVACVHEGDADLDGFRIASEVGKAIRLEGILASDVLANAPDDFGIELSPEQSKRAWAFLSSRQGDEFMFSSEVKDILARGRWIEQESFASILGKKGARG